MFHVLSTKTWCLKHGKKKRKRKKERKEAERQGDKILPDVCNWLGSAGEISQEVEKFIKDEKNAKKNCFFKLCPNLISRHQLRRQAKKMAEDVKKIQEEIADALGLKFKAGFVFPFH